MKKNIFNTIVPSYYNKHRLDKFLQSQLKEFSRTKFQNLINEGNVKLNEKVIINSSKKIIIVFFLSI